MREVLDHLAESEGLERRVDDERQMIEIQLPPDNAESRRERLPGLDLRRRLRKLPREVLPDDGTLVLTPDRQRVQEEIKLARREESAWPRLSYLWPLHPVVDWCNDKALAPMGRLEAPIVSLLDGVPRNEAIVVVSALLPNRRSQPLFQEWFAVRFVGGLQKDVVPFAAWAEKAGVARRALPNRKKPVDADALRSLVPPAVDAARATTMAHWNDRQAEIRAKLDHELERLQALRNRRFAQLVFDFGERDRKEITARVDKLFQPFFRFVEDSMTAGKEPFVEVLAVFRNEAGYAPRGGGAS